MVKEVATNISSLSTSSSSASSSTSSVPVVPILAAAAQPDSPPAAASSSSSSADDDSNDDIEVSSSGDVVLDIPLQTGGTMAIADTLRQQRAASEKRQSMANVVADDGACSGNIV
jgi:hypothetical protein